MAGVLCLATLASPAAAQVLSSKRGFADTGANYGNLQATGAGWYYTWGLGDGNPGNFDAQHAPMFWGDWAVNQNNINSVKNNPDVEWVLGFNEPERTDQANLSVAQAVSAWTTLSNGFAGSGKKLVSPAVSDTSEGRAWLTDFKNQAVSAGLQVDAVAFHWYGWSSPSNPSQAASNFIGSMNWYHNLWNKPVFVTEFAIHDWGGAYSDAEISEANRQFLDIVVPWMESTSWVEGYAWYHWFGDAHLYEGSPPKPTTMGYEYIGVIRNGETYDFSGVDHGEHVAYLANGTLTHNGAGGTIRYINALEGANTITGGTDWGPGVNWVRIQPGATLRKTGANQVTINGGSVDNRGTLEVAGGTLRLENNVSFTGGGGFRVKTGGTVTYHGVRDITSANLSYDVELAGGTLNTTPSLTAGVFVANGATLSGKGTVGAELTAQAGSTIRVGKAGLPVLPSRFVIDDFEGYANGAVRDVASPPWTAHQNTSFVAIEDDGSGNNRVLAYGWNSEFRGASRPLPENGQIEDGSVATFFFRFNSKTDDPDHTFGLGDQADTNGVNFGDFEAQVRFASDNNAAAGTYGLDARSGGTFVDLVDSLTTNTWYNLWMVVDQAADTFDVYLNTGVGDATAGNKLNASPLSFRNGTTDALSMILALAGPSPVDFGMRIDDLTFLKGVDFSNPLGGLDPGNEYDVAALMVDGDTTLNAGSILELGIVSPTVVDVLDVSGNLAAGGTLAITLGEDAAAPQVGDTFDVLDFTAASGAFDALSLPALGAGLLWDTSNLLTTGVLEVVAALEGDLNGDGFVGIADLDIVLGNWNQNVTPGNLLDGDPSGDGFVGIGDLDLVLGNWNAGTPPTANVSIPEPSSLAVLGLGGMMLFKRRH